MMCAFNQFFKQWFSWPVLWWILKTFVVPLTLPIFLIENLRSCKYYANKKKLEGKVVLITGASSGLGEALAHSFYKAGCRVILCSRRQKELERVRDELLQMYETYPTYPPVVLPIDMSNIESIFKEADKALSIYGQIDILINNAGVSYRGKVLNTSVEVDKKIMMVNYLGPVALIKAILPKMVDRQEGHIVAISSVQGLIGLPYRSVYAASKHALQGFHDSLRAEVANDNIKVTVVSPGYIKTNLSVNALRADGNKYGVMDETTAKGTDPEALAETIFKAIVTEQDEIVPAPMKAKIAILLRQFCPFLYFWIMERRANEVMKDD